MTEDNKTKRVLEYYNAYQKLDQAITSECMQQIGELKTKDDIYHAFAVTNRLFGDSILFSQGADNIINKIYEVAYDLGIYDKARISHLKTYLSTKIREINNILRDKAFRDDEYVISTTDLVWGITETERINIGIDENSLAFVYNNDGKEIIKGLNVFFRGNKLNWTTIPVEEFYQQKLKQLNLRWENFLKNYTSGKLYVDFIYQEKENLNKTPDQLLFCYNYSWLDEQLIVVGNYGTIIDGRSCHDPQEVVSYANHFLRINGIKEKLSLNCFGYLSKPEEDEDVNLGPVNDDSNKLKEKDSKAIIQENIDKKIGRDSKESTSANRLRNNQK